MGRADEQSGREGLAPGGDRTQGVAVLEEQPWGWRVCGVHPCDPDADAHPGEFHGGDLVPTVAPSPTTTRSYLTLALCR